jgi:serine/threonine protein kinase
MNLFDRPLKAIMEKLKVEIMLQEQFGLYNHFPLVNAPIAHSSNPSGWDLIYPTVFNSSLSEFKTSLAMYRELPIFKPLIKHFVPLLTALLIRAMRPLWHRGIRHGDLKLENILVSLWSPETGGINRFAVSNFSLAYQLSDGQRIAGSIRQGTTNFMPPEISSGKYLHPKSDLWTVGAVLLDLCGLSSSETADSAAQRDLRQWMGTEFPWISIMMKKTPQNRQLPRHDQFYLEGEALSDQDIVDKFVLSYRVLLKAAVPRYELDEQEFASECDAAMRAFKADHRRKNSLLDLGYYVMDLVTRTWPRKSFFAVCFRSVALNSFRIFPFGFCRRNGET